MTALLSELVPPVVVRARMSSIYAGSAKADEMEGEKSVMLATIKKSSASGEADLA